MAAIPAVLTGIQLGANIFSILYPHIKAEVVTIENTLKAPGSGAHKLLAVVGSVLGLAAPLAASGAIPGLPSADQVTAWTQGVVDAMKQAGELNGTAPAPATTPAATPDLAAWALTTIQILTAKK